MQPPNDVRGFVHKRFFRGVTKFVSSGFNPVAGVGGFFDEPARPSSRFGGAPSPRSIVARPGPCPPGRRKVRGACVKIGAILPGGVPFTTQAGGEATMGQFGAGLTPLTDTRTIRACLPGMVLGKDGLCYNKSDISNKNREHPRGRRPLGTPAEMAALAKAASFGRRMETTVKRMQKIGVLKKPRRGAPPRPQPKLLTPGVVQIQQE